MKPTELVPIPDEPSLIVSYDHLLHQGKVGIYYYFLAGSDEKYSVVRLLGSIEKKKEEEDETLRMLDLSKMYQ